MFEKYRIYCNRGFILPVERQLELQCHQRLAVVLEERVPWWRVTQLVETVLEHKDMFGCEILVHPCFSDPCTDHWQPSTHQEIERTLENFLQSLNAGDNQAHVDITLELKVHMVTVSVRMRMPVADWSEATLSRMLTSIKDQIMHFSQTQERLPKGTLSLRCEALLIGSGLK